MVNVPTNFGKIWDSSYSDLIKELVALGQEMFENVKAI